MAPEGWVLLILLLVLIALPLSAVVAYRLAVVRRHSLPVVLRVAAGPGWRHAGMRITHTELQLFRLLSARVRPDLRLDRGSLEILGTRPAGPDESQVAEPGDRVLALGARDPGGADVAFDLCLGPEEATALQSWVEACSTESVRYRDASRRGPV